MSGGLEVELTLQLGKKIENKKPRKNNSDSMYIIFSFELLDPYIGMTMDLVGPLVITEMPHIL